MPVEEHEILVGNYTWFYREALPTTATDKPPVVLLHGLLSQSYGWRNTVPVLAEQGFRAIAPDFLGSGYSDKPSRLDYAYSPDAYLQSFGQFLKALNLDRFSLVVQGFLGGTIGLRYAIQHPGACDRLAIFNAPLTSEAKLPWVLSRLGIPLAGEAFCQDFTLPDKILEGGGGYRVDDVDMNIYRRPWIKSSDAGFALNTTIRRFKLPTLMEEIEAGLKRWEKPILVGWGDRDPWLPLAQAESFVKSLPNAEWVVFEEVGHYVQEDWHEKVNDALSTFLRRQAIA